MRRLRYYEFKRELRISTMFMIKYITWGLQLKAGYYKQVCLYVSIFCFNVSKTIFRFLHFNSNVFWLKSKFDFESLKLKRDVLIGKCSYILNIFISGLTYFLGNATHINIYITKNNVCSDLSVSRWCFSANMKIANYLFAVSLI